MHLFKPFSSWSRIFLSSSCFLLALFACSLSSPSQSAISPERETTRSTVWKRLYDAMPDVWKTPQEVLVREVSDEEMDDLTRDDPLPNRSSRSNLNSRDSRDREDEGEVEGFYEYSSRRHAPTITLRSSLSSTEAEFVFTHEYGHFVWDKILTSRERDDYFRLWNHQRHNRSLVSDYAGDCVEEGFAEAFAHLLRRPEKLHKRDTNSEQFLKDIADAIEAAHHKSKD